MDTYSASQFILYTCHPVARLYVFSIAAYFMKSRGTLPSGCSNIQTPTGPMIRKGTRKRPWRAQPMVPAETRSNFRRGPSLTHVLFDVRPAAITPFSKNLQLHHFVATWPCSDIRDIDGECCSAAMLSNIFSHKTIRGRRRRRLRKPCTVFAASPGAAQSMLERWFRRKHIQCSCYGSRSSHWCAPSESYIENHPALSRRVLREL